MARFRQGLFASVSLSVALSASGQARFDLVGPKIDVRVTRAGVELPIASVPNLQPGDRIWLHPDLPATQSVHYLLIATFLRGTTNPPPDEWFTRIETWNRKVREEGVVITVPAEAEQAVLFLAPETGGDFSTLRSAVKGRPGIFVRASQDLTEAGFEQARINTYLASIKLVPPSDPAALLEHSNLLARTLNLKPNAECFKRPVDQQYNCLTQTGTQTLLDDGHGQTIVNALSTGTGSDFINAASNTRLAAGGNYSAYVGALVDLVRLTSGLHTAQYQYIPAIGAPVGSSLNLSLNTPPSFHNPKSVIVFGLPSVQPAVPPPLRPPDPTHISCLLNPKLVLPVEGAPLVFTTQFAHALVLHLNLPTGTSLPGLRSNDLPLTPDAFQGGLTLDPDPSPRHELPLDPVPGIPLRPQPLASKASNTASTPDSLPLPTEPLVGTLQGMWGFDHFSGPVLAVQGAPGTGWHIVPSGSSEHLIAGAPNHLALDSSGTACVQDIALQSTTGSREKLTWKLESQSPSEEAKPAEARDDDAKPSPSSNPTPHFRPVELTVNLQKDSTPGNVQLDIRQYGQPAPDHLGTRTFSEPAKLTGLRYHAGEQSVLLLGQGLDQVKQLTSGQAMYLPSAEKDQEPGVLRFALSKGAPAGSKVGESFQARVELRDGRILDTSGTVLPARPSISILSRRVVGETPSPIQLGSAPGTPAELPLGAQLVFFLKSASPFPRNGTIELAGPDDTLRKTLTLKDGLVLQDAHTLLATIDPLKFFGPSTFGLFRIRAVLPDPKPEGSTGDWLSLATVVRLPVLTGLSCPTDPAQTCQLTGQALYLISATSPSPDFTASTPVPEGFVDPALPISHPAGPTFYLRLRDDPTQTEQVAMPITPEPAGSKKAPTVSTSTVGARLHSGR